MKRRMVQFTAGFCLIFNLLCWANPARAFDLKAHRAISGRAVQPQISNIDDFLKAELGGPTFIRCDPASGNPTCVIELQFKEFPDGIDQSISGKAVRIWIEEGSQREDSPLPRVLAHFHNPTRTWGTAGLGIIFESAVVWAQDRAQGPGSNHSWHDARESYYKALTGRIKAERDQAWAESSEKLGHVIHLVQDLATPAHTRNDPHPVEDGFHTWAEKEGNLAIISGMFSKPFDPSILNLDTNPLAPVPIARIMDTERYRQTGIPEAGDNIGIAEYSNANFFSDDTIFSDFPFPNDLSVTLGDPEPEPKTGELRRYFRKIRHGETIGNYRLAVPSALFETLEDALADQEKGLDDNVFEDYGDLLIPRAIGYSSGLNDYFFRGRMELQSFALSATPGGCGLDIDIVCVDGVRNATPGEETGTGQMVAVFLVRQGEDIIYHVSNPLTVNLTRNFQQLAFDFSNDPLPADIDQWVCIFGGAVPCDVHLVYKGPLGKEEKAVMVIRSPVDFD